MMRRSIRADGLFLGQMAWMDTAPAAIGIALLWNVGIPGGGGSICGGNLIRGGVAAVVVDAAASIVILFARIIFILTNALSRSLYSVLQEVMSDEHGVDPTGTYHGTTEIEYCICTNVPLFCVSSLLALNAF